MQGVVPCLGYVDRAEEAMTFYVSLFPRSRIKSIVRGDGKAVPKDKVLHASFELDGREIVAFDGGEHFRFSDAFSLSVTCDTQQEIDRLWDALASGGGEPGPCGWVRDRFGVWWQVVPASLGRMMSDPASGNTAKLFEAVLTMGKLDAAALERAYRER